MVDTKNVPAVYEGTGTLIGSLPAYQEKVRQLLRAAVAPETRRAYASRLKRFFTWCQAEGISTAFPTSLLKRWLSLVELQEGPLFRRILKSGQVTGERLSAQSMRLVVLQTASAAGLSLDLSAHSLRIGFVNTLYF